jgi:AcrR family transcriptional regulator
VSTSSARRTPLPRRRDEAKALFRNAILDAAEHIFARQGFHGARIQDIADHARIAVGTVYNHFEQKEDVLRALLEERLEHVVECLAPRDTDPAPFDQRLERCVGRMLHYVGEHRDFHQVALDCGLFAKGSASTSTALGDKRIEHIERFREALLTLVNEGIAQGALRAMEPARLAMMLGGMLRTFIICGIEQGLPDLESEAPLIVDLFLNGAGATQERGDRTT